MVEVTLFMVKVIFELTTSLCKNEIIRLPKIGGTLFLIADSFLVWPTSQNQDYTFTDQDQKPFQKIRQPLSPTPLIFLSQPQENLMITRSTSYF